MTREEALNLQPGDKIFLADKPFDNTAGGYDEYWGTTQMVARIDPESDYPVRIGSGSQFAPEEIIGLVFNEDLDDIFDDADIKLLFGGDG